MASPSLIDRLLDVIETDIVPKTLGKASRKATSFSAPRS